MEYRKLFRKKIVWVTVVLLAAGMSGIRLSGLFGRYYVNGEPTDTHANMLRTDSAYARSLSGRPIDDRLLREMQEAYRKYRRIRKYPTQPQRNIRNMPVLTARSITLSSGWRETPGYNIPGRSVSAPSGRGGAGMEAALLTDAEKGYLEKQEDSLEVPFVYGYDDGYTNYMSLLFTTGLLLLLGIAVCVPQIFPKNTAGKRIS